MMKSTLKVCLVTSIGTFNMEAEVLKTDKFLILLLGDKVYKMRDQSPVGEVLKENPSSLSLTDITTIKEFDGNRTYGPSSLCELSFLGEGGIQKAYFGRISKAQFDAGDTFRALKGPLPGTIPFVLGPQAVKPYTPKQLESARIRRAENIARRQAKDVLACMVAEQQALLREANASAKALARAQEVLEAARVRASKAKAAAEAYFAR